MSKRVTLDLEALEREIKSRRTRLEEAAAFAGGAVNPTYTFGRASGLLLALSLVRELSEDAE